MNSLPKYLKHGGLALFALATSAVWPLAAQAEQYKLGVQDRLRVHVSEWPALTGEVVVGAGGEISLPLIGQIPAADLDTAELGRKIAQRLMDKVNLTQLPDTSVEVIAYRPFYILGSVTSPGEYLYRPGMLVLNAMSIAGGVYRAERRSEWDIERVAINSRGEISVLVLRRQDLRAEKIRLTAELDGLDVFPPSPADAEPQLLRALEEQQRIFDGMLEGRRSDKAALETSITSREKEIASITQQVADVAQKRQATEKELEQVRGLVKRDLAVHRLFPLERTLADVLREQQELEISKLRAEQQLSELHRELGNLDEQRRNGALAGIQRVNAQLREVDEQHKALASLLDGAAYYSSEIADAADGNDAPQLRYVIVRAEGDKTSEIDATETTRVMPGDVVKVLRVVEPTITGALPSQPNVSDPNSATPR